MQSAGNGRRSEGEEEGRLEAAFSFFFIKREIKFHQRAESQLISLKIKTAVPHAIS
jgi:hypothetical protein